MINLEENPISGQIDLECLERELKKASSKGGTIIGCFAAASNVTGVMNDDLAGNFYFRQLKKVDIPIGPFFLKFYGVTPNGKSTYKVYVIMYVL